MWVALVQSVNTLRKMLSSSEEERIPLAVADCLWTQATESALSWVSSLQADSAGWDLLAYTIL